MEKSVEAWCSSKSACFLVAVLRGILPDYGTLSRRHVMANSTCGICKAKPETLWHALIECSHAKMFWEAAKTILCLKLPRLHPETWAPDILCESFFSEKEKAMIITVMYQIWTSRNNVTHGEKSYEPSKTMEFVKGTIIALEMPQDQSTLKSPRPDCKWKEAPRGIIKFNSDGAIQSSSGMAGVGIVARAGSVFRGAMCKTYTGLL
jgi:hypothetical protein